MSNLVARTRPPHSATVQWVEGLLGRVGASVFLQQSFSTSYIYDLEVLVKPRPNPIPAGKHLAGKNGPFAVYSLAVIISSVLLQVGWCHRVARGRGGRNAGGQCRSQRTRRPCGADSRQCRGAKLNDASAACYEDKATCNMARV